MFFFGDIGVFCGIDDISSGRVYVYEIKYCYGFF